ncbi:MAG: transcriptional regulator [Nanoarchaeota archaeon]
MAKKAILHPQEIEVYYIIPTLRRALAGCLAQQGMKQKDIATLLGINTAAISQYRSNKRGNQVTFSMEIQREIQKSAVLIKDKLSYFRETQRLLRHIRTTNTLCQIHKQFTAIPEGCDPEHIGCHLMPLTSSTISLIPPITPLAVLSVPLTPETKT